MGTWGGGKGNGKGRRSALGVGGKALVWRRGGRRWCGEGGKGGMVWRRRRGASAKLATK